MTESAGCASAIIPAHNEADRIADTIRALRRIRAIGQIIVVDDGSRDGTAQAAREAGADTAMRREKRGGKGEALLTGLAVATQPIVAFVDADIGESAEAISRLIEPVASGECDMAIASPGPTARGGFGIVVRTAREGIRRLCRVEMRSPLSGQRAMRRELLERIGTLESGYGIDVALTIDALRAGARLLEVPIQITHRELGRTIPGFAHRARQWLDVRRALRRRALSRP